VTKEKPWWKQLPVAAPDAPRAVRPPPEAPDDGGDNGDDDDDGEGPDDEVTGATSATDLADGESTTVRGSGAQPYVLKNTGGVYSCSCPAWRNQSAALERRSCKHLRRLRGDAAETARVGAAASPARTPRTAGGTTAAPAGTAPPILLAHPWDNVADLTGWWMSEKLDGVRAYWDGARFVSRLGNEYHAPDWFIASLPRVPLDGELWAGRKKFQRAVSIARRQDRSDAWRELTYVVFDAPAVDAPFEQRLELVQQQLEAHRSAHARWHPHERCTGTDHLRAELARVEALGGEGLMMRQPGSRYEVGRSWTLRKVKTFHDAEARVIAHVRGAGRHDGRLGSLQCEMPDGTVFHVGTGLSDAERNAPPPVGSVVTYRYQELSDDGVPRFPSYVGVRHDLPWPPPDTPARPRVAAAAPAPATATAPATAAASEANRRSFVRGVTMWSIELEGRTVKVTGEAPGEARETTTRRNTNPAGAWRDAERLIAEKLAAGYVEIIP
jgi:DNA ligase-1